MNNEPITNIKFLIFDVDSTITAWGTNDLWVIPQKFFEDIYAMPHKPFIALATNQGGVGLRYWMEHGGWGEPSKYPTEDAVRQRMWLISEGVRRLSGVEKVPVYMSFMYQSKKGDWSPMKENKPEWQKGARKPAPGMLIRAMTDAGMLGEQTLMVGDSEEDEKAAERAGCHFIPVSKFFYSQSTPGCEYFNPNSVL